MTLASLPAYLAQTTLAVSLLIVLILLIRARFAKAFGPKAAYALWAIPLLRLVLPPLPESWTLIGWLRQPAPEPQSFILHEAGMALPSHLTFLPADTTLIDTPSQTSFGSFATENIALMGPYLAALWLAGFCAFIAFTLVRQYRSDAQTRPANAPLPMPACTLAATLKTRLDLANISIKTSADTDGPRAQGLLKPTIWLPETFTADYSPAQQRLALLHEMMHIKRGDLWALHLAMLALAAQWFNPLAWLAMRAFRIDQEAACDADVLEQANVNPYTYGETLVSAARASRAPAFNRQATSLPLNHALHERLNAMKNPRPSQRKRFTGSVLTTSVGIAALLASACATSTAQTADLAGADEEVKARVKVESIFISDEGDESHNIRIIQNGEEVDLTDLENIDIEGLDGERQIRIITKDGEHSLGGASNVFIMKAEGDAARPDSKAFAAKMKELAKDPVKNQAEIQSLAAEFETKMEAWAEQHAQFTTGTVQFHTSDFEWTESGEECEDGSSVRTVIVQKDDATGSEEKNVTVKCGSASFDTDAIMADLEARGDISEERLAEIRGKLEEARERLNTTHGELGKMRFEFELDTDKTEE